MRLIRPLIHTALECPTFSRRTWLQNLQNGYVVVNLCSVLLRNALCDPHDISALLLLQLEIGIEDPKVELVEKGIDIELYLMLKELVL